MAPDASGSPEPGVAAPDSRALFARIFPSIMLPMFIAVVDQTIVATALPAISGSLGHAERVSWIIICYLIANTVAAPVYGRLGDAFGRRRVMLGALSVMVAASTACALSTSLFMLCAFRVLQGLGGGGLMTLSQALIGETIPPRERARYQGYLAAVVVVSNSFGPIAGGWLTEHIGWRAVFWINLPLGILAILLALRLPDRRPEGETWRFDTGGLIFFVLFVAPALLALEQLRQLNLSSAPLLLALVALAAVSAILLVRQERRQTAPLLPFSLWKLPAIWRSDALAACHGAIIVPLIALVPIYLHTVRGLSPAQTGSVLVPFAVGIGTGSLITGRLVSATGRTAIFPSFGLLPVLGILIAMAAGLSHLSMALFTTAFGVMAIFLGTVMGVVQVTVQSAAPPGMIGAAAGSVQFSRAVGAAFGTALASMVLFATLNALAPDSAGQFAAMMSREADLVSTGADLRAALDSSFRMVFLLAGLFATAALGFAWSIPVRRL